MVLEPRAMDLLKATSAKLAAAKSMSFTATVGYEYPSKLGPPIVYTSRYDVTMQRPDKLRILMPGDGPASEFYYDGKPMMAYSPAENLAAVADAPPTIDAALMAAFDKASIFFPFTDLLAADPYAALTEARSSRSTSVRPGSSAARRPTWWRGRTRTCSCRSGSAPTTSCRAGSARSSRPIRSPAPRDGVSNWQLDPVLPPDTFVSAKAQAAGRWRSPARPAAGGEADGTMQPAKARQRSRRPKAN